MNDVLLTHPDASFACIRVECHNRARVALRTGKPTRFPWLFLCLDCYCKRERGALEDAAIKDTASAAELKIESEAQESILLVNIIRPLLAGRDVMVQRSVVAELLAILTAGFPDWAREDAIAAVVTLAREFIPVEEEELWKGKGHPHNGPDPRKEFV